MKVSKDAEQLVNSLNELLSVGSADKRLFKELSGFNHPLFRYRDSYGTWDYILSDPHNPHIKLRSLIADIKAAAESACDTPCKIENSDGKNQDVIDLFLDAYNSEAHQEERRKRKLERKTPRDLPLRKSIQLLKGFFDEHVEIPFTAGKYYPELGYKSHAFEAVKLVLEQIYPDISDRKIASLMQEMVTQ
ncbi:MAG: hypothetical protein KAJ29_06500 [Alphaproteobacteria bacterium]|nr:hypothetical protein [Alphaproteobacteria bacterium]